LPLKQSLLNWICHSCVIGTLWFSWESVGLRNCEDYGYIYQLAATNAHQSHKTVELFCVSYSFHYWWHTFEMVKTHAHTHLSWCLM